MMVAEGSQLIANLVEMIENLKAENSALRSALNLEKRNDGNT